MKVPRVFSLVTDYMKRTIEEITELNLETFLPEWLDLKEIARFQLFVCDTYDALGTILKVKSDLLPHQQFHIIVGAAVAESESELLNYANSFIDLVESTSQNSIPFLFVFSDVTANDAKLSQYSTLLPADTNDVTTLERHVKQGLLLRFTNFIMNQSAEIERLANNESAESYLKIASILWIFGGFTKASEYFEQALKLRSVQINTEILELSLSPKYVGSVDKYCNKSDLPVYFEDLKESNLPLIVRSILSNANDVTEKTCIIRILYKLAARYQEHSRRFILQAIKFCRKHKKKYMEYYQLGLLLLNHFGHSRTFLYEISDLYKTRIKLPPYLIDIFARAITSANDWLDQRIHIASQLFLSEDAHREIKIRMIEYLLDNLHAVNPEKQEQFIKSVPAGTQVVARNAIEVTEFRYIIPDQPIERATKGNSVFIFNALQKRSLGNVVSVGDQLSFMLTLKNPLNVNLEISVMAIDSTSGFAQPFACNLRAKKSAQLPLTIKMTQPGKIEILGATFNIYDISFQYKLPKPIEFEVIEELPTLIACLPFRQYDNVTENSYNEISFELINSGNVEVDIHRIKFAQAPPIYSGTSLPVPYPPKLNPSLPPTLNPGQSYKFNVQLQMDQTFTNLSFGIEYGRRGYIRRFEYDRQLSLIDGPRITRVETVPLEDHNDFDDDHTTLLIIIQNPTNDPITVDSNIAGQVFIPRQSFGTLIVRIQRIETPDDFTGKWNDIGLTTEYVRKAEVAEINAKQREISDEERRLLWTALYIKQKICQQLTLKWHNQHGFGGNLPLSHVILDPRVLTLLQKPSFDVNISIKKQENDVYSLTCDMKSENKKSVDVKAMLTFNAEKSSVMIAGKSVYQLKTPSTINMIVHTTCKKKLLVTGKFYVGEAFFVKLAEFDLSEL
ncbi:hypothetical protein TVAG_237960 [Trichomonas vaginalis G3]|uniref:Trs120/TRAPPC9 first Ig-like domain-containing protein n=1 Tax=Trichomonas vaginalis (strain ATCC PRA-98 / G3) TaxID=412133 RepID=A2DCZ6_TRIV3|nr:trafficking protein particle complex subunit 9 family [Trichomonas vaginalis G3]EAY21770.1 hypothetical protein TVAG_237960 [Trichomonas vaginalis G3]KAI5524258.1 trafficking protein particle complex subunit 9 family [Trichomonas vaginalis G3]|eukprot:XP_001582756.1 hypothetical protein [Trichomonas vaginalis G3]